jgi:DinB superfamily
MPDVEVWLRGPLRGIDPMLMPVAHTLLQVAEDARRVVAGLSPDDLRARPGGAASVCFHLRHIAGSIDRLCTYARGEGLSEAQLRVARDEVVDLPEPHGAALVALVSSSVDGALEQVRSTPRSSLPDPRRVGRAGLPSTVIGLLFHCAEHALRHSGQALTTARIVGAMKA